jgi:hypothetical protein
VAAVTAVDQNGKSKLVVPPSTVAKKPSLWPFGNGEKGEKDEGPPERPQTNESAPKSFKLLHTFTDVVEAKVKATKERQLAKIKAEKEKGLRTIMPHSILGRVSSELQSCQKRWNTTTTKSFCATISIRPLRFIHVALLISPITGL